MKKLIYLLLFIFFLSHSLFSLDFYHEVKKINPDTRTLTLEDGSCWKINWLNRKSIRTWLPGHKLKIYFHTPGNIQFENINLEKSVFGTLEKAPSPKYSYSIFHNLAYDLSTITLNNGLVFKPMELDYTENRDWQIYDKILIFHSHNQTNLYDLLNMRTLLLVRDWLLMGEKNPKDLKKLPLDIVLHIEDTLNKRVLGQKEATHSVSTSIINYYSGLNDPQKPIGVFLFLGPTGVGKTELAKAISSSLYKNPAALIRFDMNQFTEAHSVARLVGSPPGYVNHDEGGQLSESLKANPRSVILLDEFEKAHPTVHKFFLSVFDEGYVVDSKNQKISCQEVIFVMTSNICSEEIISLFQQNLDSKEILELLEPAIVQVFSPEFYNRTEPIIFHPLEPNIMHALVEMMLKEVKERLKSKKMELIVDKSVVDYCVQNGYHATHGARHLKLLIQKKVVAAISEAIMKDNIPEGSKIYLFYYPSKDKWHVKSILSP